MTELQMSLYYNGSMYFQNVVFSLTEADVGKPEERHRILVVIVKETVVIETFLEWCSQHSGTPPISWQFLLYNLHSMGRLLADCKV